MTKKLVAAILTASMVFSLTACGDDNTLPTTPADGQTTGSTSTEGSGEGGGDILGNVEQNEEITSDGFEADLSSIIPKETITLDISSQTANTSSAQIGWFADVMKDKFNVNINIIHSDGDNFTTLMEQGDLGDIVTFGEIGDNYYNSIENGYLLNWEEDDLMKNYAPYIYSLKDTDFAKVFSKVEDPNAPGIYSIGNEIAAGESHQSFIYYPALRWDLYKAIGSPEINTLEDYIDVLADMQAKEPTSDIGTKTYGVTLHTAWETTAFMVMYVKSTAAFYGWDEFHCGLYNSDTHEFQGCLQEDGIYFRCLKFYNSLNQKGLVDPDSETNGWDECAEAMLNGETLMDIFNYVGESYNTPEHLNAGKAMVPVQAKDFTTLCYGLNNYGGVYPMAIGSKTEYPELCMAIINWFYTPKGFLTMIYGPEATSQDPKDEDGIWYIKDNQQFLTDLGKSIMEDNNIVYHGVKWAEGQCGMNDKSYSVDATNPLTNGETYDYKKWPSYSGLGDYEIIKDYYDTYGVTNFDEYIDKVDDHVVVVPSTDYTSSTQSRKLKSTYAYVYDIVKTYSWRAIKATSDSEYDGYIKEMIEKANDAGYADCLEYSEGEAAIRTEKEIAVAGK